MKMKSIFVLISLQLLLQADQCFARCRYGTKGCPGNMNICVKDIRWCDTINDCPDGADEQNCPSDCSGPNQFKCGDGKCIPRILECDHEQDCGDNSDESQCNFNVTCLSNQFKCSGRATTPCISPWDVCNWRDDCGDNSDEEKPCAVESCDPGKIMCPDKLGCYEPNERCDGINDCRDHSDENNCTCTDAQFDCQNGRCIYLTYKCDGYNHCGNMEDETKEVCGSIHPGACHDKMPYLDCLRMNASTYPICQYHSDAFEYCRKFCNVCVN